MFVERYIASIDKSHTCRHYYFIGIRTVAATSSKTGGYNNFLPFMGGKCISNPSSSAIRIARNSLEFCGFFLPFSAFEVQNVLNFKGGFLFSLTVSLISLRT